MTRVQQHSQPGPAYGPGQAGYVAALASYDAAFGAFFKRLASHSINSSNTLFVFTADEGDHFVGGAPSPAGCDGVTTPFKVHSDSAPTIYITGNGAPPVRTDPTVRTFDQALGGLTAVNPITGNTD